MKKLSECPDCGGPADNGHDRCLPPNPYICKACEKINEELRGETSFYGCQKLPEYDLDVNLAKNNLFLKLAEMNAFDPAFVAMCVEGWLERGEV